MLLKGEIAGRERKAGEGEKKQREKGNSQVLPPVSSVLAPSRDVLLGHTGSCQAAALAKGGCKPHGRLGTASCSSKKSLKRN